MTVIFFEDDLRAGASKTSPCISDFRYDNACWRDASVVLYKRGEDTKVLKCRDAIIENEDVF